MIQMAEYNRTVHSAETLCVRRMEYENEHFK